MATKESSEITVVKIARQIGNWTLVEVNAPCRSCHLSGREPGLGVFSTNDVRDWPKMDVEDREDLLAMAICERCEAEDMAAEAASLDAAESGAGREALLDDAYPYVD